MTNLRSEDWSVRPSFVPNGPTSPVVLLADDTGLTQLAGIPSVAWQTPWSEISNLVLVRIAHQMALFGTVAGVRYCWRHKTLEDFEAVRTVVLEHGGTVTQRRRRIGVLVVAAVVLLASVAGGIASLASNHASPPSEVAKAKAANLKLNDLPSGWYKSSSSLLTDITGQSGKVYPSTTVTTAPKKNSPFVKAATIFQSCLGVSNKNDRTYGAAGQEADYQVSSPTFATNSLSGIEIITTSQYYRTTTMVDKDTREMRMSNFGSCFVTSTANLVLAATGLTQTEKAPSQNWRPMTFAKGFVRGGEVALKVPGIAAKLDLAEAIITHGHYEISMIALVGSFAKAKSFLASVVNTLLSKITNTTTTAA